MRGGAVPVTGDLGRATIVSHQHPDHDTDQWPPLTS